MRILSIGCENVSGEGCIAGIEIIREPRRYSRWFTLPGSFARRNALCRLCLSEKCLAKVRLWSTQEDKEDSKQQLDALKFRIWPIHRLA